MNIKKLGRILIGWIMVIICVCCMKISVFAMNTQQTIRVGCFPLNGFFNIDDQTGKVTGYGADFTEEVFNHLDWDYEFVKYASWGDALDALSRNEIDILAPAQHTAERDAIYEFDSFPISTEYGTLLSLSTNDKLVYEDYQSYNNLNVGVVPSLIFLDKFKEYEKRNNFEVDLTYYKDTSALIAALNAGEVDAILANMMVKTDSMKLLARFGAAPVYYMISPGAKNIQEEINFAIDTLSSENPELQNHLNSIYFSDFDQLPFSKEELEYIDNCGTIKVACRPDCSPFSYIDENTGQIEGVEKALLEKISKISGLSFSYMPITDTNDINKVIEISDAALVTGVESSVDTKLHISNYSENYMSISKYFVGLKNKSLDTSKDYVVAVENVQDEQINILTKQYINFKFEAYESMEQCIKAVRDGDADFFLGERYSMENILSSPRNDDLKIYPTEAIRSNLCFQVLLKDANETNLTSIINKSIHQLSDKEKEELLNEYTQKNRYQYSVSDFVYQYRIQIVFAGIIVLIVIVALILFYHTRKKTRLKIEENEMKLRNITNNINGGVIVLIENEGLSITYANDGFLELIGCTREEFNKNGNGSYLAYVHPDDLQILKEAIDSEKNELSIELRVQRSDGSYVPALFNCTSAEKSNGVIEHYCVILDMTEQNKMIEQLRVDKRRTDLILERVDEIFYEIDLRDESVSTSLSFYQKMGWKLPERMPDDKKEYGSMWHTDSENLKKMEMSTLEMLEKKEPVSAIVLLKSELENRFVWCEVFQHPILSDDGSIITIIGLIRDVDEQVSERQRLLEQAQRDPLTGLYNKETFEIIVTDTLQKMPTQNHALIFIDLDHFKDVNDTLGHMTGDQAICDAADKLKIIFSNFDVLSRFGGDEFCVFVKNIPFETVNGKMKWLIDKIHHEYSGEKGTVQITCSCGIACTEYVGYAYETMMKCADEALYYSKEHGRDKYTFYKEIVNK